MLRSLKPWSANLKKRQVKAPKVYIRDSGLLHHFLGVTTRTELERHPKIGASWEGFIIENLIQALGVDERHCYFWGRTRGRRSTSSCNADRGCEASRSSARAHPP